MIHTKKNSSCRTNIILTCILVCCYLSTCLITPSVEHISRPQRFLHHAHNFRIYTVFSICSQLCWHSLHRMAHEPVSVDFGHSFANLHTLRHHMLSAELPAHRRRRRRRRLACFLVVRPRISSRPACFSEPVVRSHRIVNINDFHSKRVARATEMQTHTQTHTHGQAVTHATIIQNQMP